MSCGVSGFIAISELSGSENSLQITVPERLDRMSDLRDLHEIDAHREECPHTCVPDATRRAGCR
jgi:hypothetical protein